MNRRLQLNSSKKPGLQRSVSCFCLLLLLVLIAPNSVLAWPHADFTIDCGLFANETAKTIPVTLTLTQGSIDHINLSTNTVDAANNSSYLFDPTDHIVTTANPTMITSVSYSTDNLQPTRLVYVVGSGDYNDHPCDSPVTIGDMLRLNMDSRERENHAKRNLPADPEFKLTLYDAKKTDDDTYRVDAKVESIDKTPKDGHDVHLFYCAYIRDDK